MANVMVDENNENIVSNSCSALGAISPKLRQKFLFSPSPRSLRRTDPPYVTLSLFTLAQHHVYFAPIKSIAAKRQLILRESCGNFQCACSWKRIPFDSSFHFHVKSKLIPYKNIPRHRFLTATTPY